MEPKIPANQLAQTIEPSAYDETLLGTRPSNVLSGTFLRIGRYVLLRKLGEGAMGVVYAAFDEDLDRKVAIKVVHPEKQQSHEIRMRSVREAQALARISAPNVVQVYEVGELSNQMFIVMEFVRGTTLTKWASEKRRSWQEILRMYRAAGQGLLDAHDAGLAHRDFKPDNVLVGSDGRPRVADFGLARLADAPFHPQPAEPAEQDPSLIAASSVSMRNSPALTQVGAVMGTPQYMSPEQYKGQPADARSDQFSFCVALFEALYGYLPFAADNLLELRDTLLTGKVKPRPIDSPVPMRVHQALLHGMATDPAARFPSMRELLEQLYFDEERDPAAAPVARRMFTVALCLAILLVSGSFFTVIWRGADPCRAALKASVAFLVAICMLAFLFRQMIMNNTFHRTIVIIGLSFAGLTFGQRVLGVYLGMSPAQFFAVDTVSMTTMAALMAALSLPRLWAILPIGLGNCVLYLYRPAYAVVIGETLAAVTVLAVIILWNLAARHSTTPRHTQAAS
jgi:tRNA A-37 threonylcarbamoyl transferase component Bud32